MNAASGAQPAPPPSAPLQEMSEDAAVVRARIIERWNAANAAPSSAFRASREQPAPSAAAPLQETSADFALIRAMIIHRADKNPPSDIAARRDSVWSLVEKIDDQAQPRVRTSSRGGAFSRHVPPRECVGPDRAGARLFPSFPALHQETQESFARYGLLPFVSHQNVPWDSSFFFREQINIDQEGDDTFSTAMQWLDSFFFLLLKIFDCNYGRFE